MDVTTGEIKEFESEKELAEALLTGKWERLERMPNPNCNRCHGRGHLGFNVSRGQYVVCRCVKKREKKEVDHAVENDQL